MSKYTDYVAKKKDSNEWEDFRTSRKISNTKWRKKNREKYNEYIKNYRHRKESNE